MLAIFRRHFTWIFIFRKSHNSKKVRIKRAKYLISVLPIIFSIFRTGKQMRMRCKNLVMSGCVYNMPEGRAVSLVFGLKWLNQKMYRRHKNIVSLSKDIFHMWWMKNKAKQNKKSSSITNGNPKYCIMTLFHMHNFP